MASTSHLDLDRYFFSDIPGLNIEENVEELRKAFSRTSDDSNQFIVDENLSPQDKAIHLLINGTRTQRLSVCRQLPTIVMECGDNATKKLAQYFGETLWKSEEYLQVACGIAFQEFTARLSPTKIRHFLPLIKSMVSLKKVEVVKEWKDVLILSISAMPIDLIRGEVLSFALSKGSLSETTENRMLCCRLLGSMALRLKNNSNIIEEGFLMKAMSLCQDTELQVRQCMCRQLGSIARGIGLRRAKEVLMKELFELLRDEEPDVKSAALECLISLIDFLDSQYRKEHVLPFLRSVILSTTSENSVFRVLVTNFGPLIWSLSAEIADEEDITSFCNFFKRAAQSRESTMRKACAYNFPGVLKSIGNRRYGLHLHSTFRALSEDREANIRVTIACGFHEVCLTLGHDRSVQYLRDILIQMLQDPSLEVRDAVMNNINSSLVHFKSKNNEKDQFVSLLLSHVLNFEVLAQKSWRRAELFVSKFYCFADFFPVDAIHEKFIPIVKNYLLHGFVPVKKKAAEMIVVLCRKLSNYGQQLEIFNGLIETFGRSRSYWDRITFLHICSHVMTVFSRKYFTDMFLDLVLEMAKDPVSNVRSKFCELLPGLKKVLRPPSDVAMLTRLNENISFLTLDRDRDVGDAAKQASAQIAVIDAEILRDQHLHTKSQEGKLDAHKEEEENQWIETWKELERLKRKKQVYAEMASSSSSNSSSTSINTGRRKDGPDSSTSKHNISAVRVNAQRTVEAGKSKHKLSPVQSSPTTSNTMSSGSNSPATPMPSSSSFNNGFSSSSVNTSAKEQAGRMFQSKSGGSLSSTNSSSSSGIGVGSSSFIVRKRTGK